MVVRVETGGMKTFDYSKIEKRELSSDKKRQISEAYGKYYERKRRDKKNKIIFWILVSLGVILLAYFFLLR
jgi:hypothetical protein